MQGTLLSMVVGLRVATALLITECSHAQAISRLFSRAAKRSLFTLSLTVERAPAPGISLPLAGGTLGTVPFGIMRMQIQPVVSDSVSPTTQWPPKHISLVQLMYRIRIYLP